MKFLLVKNDAIHWQALEFGTSSAEAPPAKAQGVYNYVSGVSEALTSLDRMQRTDHLRQRPGPAVRWHPTKLSNCNEGANLRFQLEVLFP